MVVIIKQMKKLFILFVILITSYELFAVSIKDVLARIPVTSLPFDATKIRSFHEPRTGLSSEKTTNLPMFTYRDLGLSQRNDYNEEEECAIFRKFSIYNGTFDLVALDINVSDPGKQLITTYKDGELIDFIETEVSWYSRGALYVEQWRIDKNQEIIVTHLKVISSTPIIGWKDFGSVQAQRIDTYYQIDSSGKFHEIKQMKYQSQTYTQSYLEDKTKNLWEESEVPVQ